MRRTSRLDWKRPLACVAVLSNLMRNASSFSLVIAALMLAACGGGTEQPTGSSTSTGSGGAGGSGGSTTSSTGSGPGITAPDETWTWIPVDGTSCADGSATGIGVNLSKKSSRVLIYLEGGGACWDEITCYTLGTASNFTSGYGETQFKSDASAYLNASFFNRDDAQNPLKDYSFVYIPYCTGDIHAGNNVATYGAHMAHHKGFVNVTEDLKRIVPTFPNADRVIIGGSSAGGFGATYNWWQAQEAFGKIRVDLIDDSGTVMPADIPVQNTDTELKTWNLTATLPPGCTGCDMHLDALIGFYAAKFPDHRAALFSYTKDTVLPTFFQISTAQFTQGLTELTTTELDPTTTFKYFVDDASGHVLWFDPTLTVNGTTLQTFVTQMVTDSKDWNSVHP